MTRHKYHGAVQTFHYGPPNFLVDFLLVGGGGAGVVGYCGGGGGAGGFIECTDYELPVGNYPITIGAGGIGAINNTTCRQNGGDSCFNDIIAYGGGAGGVCNTQGASDPRSGGSGGGGGPDMGCGRYGAGCEGQGSNGGPSIYWRTASPYPGGAGGGGAGEAGKSCRGSGGKGGDGKCSCISGECLRYAGGGGGGCKQANAGIGGCGGGGYGGAACVACAERTNATYYGGGGGGAPYFGTGSCKCASGYQGVFILRYPTACNYNICGGCEYTCGDYTIHCFTSDGTLCAISDGTLCPVNKDLYG